MRLRLYKSEKLCSVTAINTLFDRHAANFTHAAFPIRVFWKVNSERTTGAPLQFLISVPKKRLRHAVDRVTMRRRIREAFRLHHHAYPLPEGVRIDVAFVYVDSKLHSYQRVEGSMLRLLKSISSALAEQPDDADATNRIPTDNGQ